MTVTLRNALPPGPEQDSENVAAVVSGFVSSEPDVALVPDQLSEATHSVALVLDQVSVVASPEDTTAGLAENETVGTAGRLGLAGPPD